jgi:hypothetical protein
MGERRGLGNGETVVVISTKVWNAWRVEQGKLVRRPICSYKSDVYVSDQAVYSLTPMALWKLLVPCFTCPTSTNKQLITHNWQSPLLFHTDPNSKNNLDPEF